MTSRVKDIAEKSITAGVHVDRGLTVETKNLVLDSLAGKAGFENNISVIQYFYLAGLYKS
jgi:hypothetical protein